MAHQAKQHFSCDRLSLWDALARCSLGCLSARILDVAFRVWNATNGKNVSFEAEVYRYRVTHAL
eukprot:6264055-Amphidinium_carterae.1